MRDFDPPHPPTLPTPTHAHAPRRVLGRCLQAIPPALGLVLPLVALAPSAAAQGLALLDAPAPPPLPKAPILERWFLEEPLLPAAIFVGLGVAAWFALASTPRRAILAATLAVVLAGATLALAWMVATPREQAASAARALVRAVAAGDVREVDRLLDPRVTLVADAPFLRTGGMPKDAILSRVAEEFGPSGRAGVADPTLLELQALARSSDFVQIQMKIRVTSSAWNFPALSWWRMDLSRDGAVGPWRTVGIQPLSFSGGARR